MIFKNLKKRWGISAEHWYQKNKNKWKFQKRKFKNSVNEFNHRLETIDEKISELERGSLENV